MPSEVYTVVGRVYTSVDEALAPEGVEVGGKMTVVTIPPIVNSVGGGLMLDVSAKVPVVSPALIIVFQNQISSVVTSHDLVSRCIIITII